MIGKTNVKVKPNKKVEYVEYIESTGTQYIDTGYVPTTSTKIEFECSTNGEFDVGSRKSFGNNGFVAYIRYTQSDIAIGLGQFTEMYEYDYTGSNTRHKYAFDSIGNFYIDDSHITSEAGTFDSSTYPIYLLLFNNGGTAVTGSNYGGKLYSCKIYENNILVHDFKPAIDSNGVYFLYDNVKKTYHYNQGTGSFLGGASI